MASDISEGEIRRLTALTRIHQSIGASLELSDICRILVRELIGLTACDACAVILIDNDFVTVLAEKGFTRTFGSVKLARDTPAIDYILRTQKPIYSGDVANSPASACVPSGCAMKSIICMPVVVNNSIKGIIHLDASRKDAFSSEILDLVGLLAREIAIAVERSMAYSELRDLSIRDGLTGCFNRRKFDVDLAANIAYARKTAEPLALLMLDIDWFKKYNDFHGHPMGDALLRRMVEVLQKTIRPLDWLYRYGGEEFAVILTEADKQVALVVANRILKAVQAEKFSGEQQSQPGKKVTVSIGAASVPADAEDRDELLKKADSAFLRAKSEGRNRVCAANEQ